MDATLYFPQRSTCISCPLFVIVFCLSVLKGFTVCFTSIQLVQSGIGNVGSVEARRMHVCGEPQIRALDQIHGSCTARPGSRTTLAGHMDTTINYLLYDAPYLHHVEYDHRQFY